jgi:hypothetical protein
MMRKANLTEELARLEMNFQRRIKNRFSEMQRIDDADLNKNNYLNTSKPKKSESFSGIKSWLQNLFQKSEI